MDPAASTLAIKLRRPEDLFVTPVFDWQQPPIAPVSGVLLALAHLEASDAAQPVSIRFEFSEPLPAGAADRLPVALANYCHQQVAVHRAAASDIRHQGWRSLRRGLLALVLALSLATFFRHVHPLPDLFNGLFSEGLVIVGWVVLWHPLEQLIYDGAPHRRRARLFKLLAICPAEFASAAASP